MELVGTRDLEQSIQQHGLTHRKAPFPEGCAQQMPAPPRPQYASNAKAKLEQGNAITIERLEPAAASLAVVDTTKGIKAIHHGRGDHEFERAAGRRCLESS